MNSNQYPEDEFDLQGSTLPAGAHRKPVSKWHIALPFIAVIILAPILAWGCLYLIDYSGDSNSSASSVNKTDSSSKKAKVKKQVKKAKEEAEKKAAQQEEAKREREQELEKAKAEQESKKQAEQQPVLNTKVKIFNGTPVTGLAGRVAEKIKASSFTNVSAGNNPGINANATTVYYSSQNLKATAEKIAQLLGTSNVVEDSSAPGGDGIAVLLLKDYRE